jgi:dihydroorotase
MTTAIINGLLVNEGVIAPKTIIITDNFITDILAPDAVLSNGNIHIIDAKGLHILPGIIDDQVHFREPGLTHKGEIYTEAKAAVAGGITSFMEMPNTNPATLTQNLLQKKFVRAAQVSLANYSFFMGASNDNLNDVLATDIKNVCGIKIFMGSSTGNMLVDNEEVLAKIFKNAKTIIATHCEDETTVKRNMQQAQLQYGDSIPVTQHPIIRSAEACYLSSSKAVALATKFDTQLHVLHISTAKEVELFSTLPLSQKRITAEACIHHLWFTDADYVTKQNFIKWNPAIKTIEDKAAIWQGVLNGNIDVIATDHAPHTLAEKQQPYTNAPSGGPLVQHALQAMVNKHLEGQVSLEVIVKKMCHNMADLFKINKRGYVRKGYYADLTLINLNQPYTVSMQNILSKCGWSPFTDYTFKSTVVHTFVNGNHVYNNGSINETTRGMALTFNR